MIIINSRGGGASEGQLSIIIFYFFVLFLFMLNPHVFRNTASAQNPAGNIPLIGGITGGIGKLFG